VNLRNLPGSAKFTRKNHRGPHRPYSLTIRAFFSKVICFCRDAEARPACAAPGPKRIASLRSVRIFKNNSKSNGYEILSDYQRSLLKLPPRGPDGWTVEEVLAWDAYRVASMFKPIVMTELTPEQERDLREEWGGGSGAIAWISPTTQSEK
jgi:hypothetical protein